MGVMEHFLLLVPGPLPGCILMRQIILAFNTVYKLLKIATDGDILLLATDTVAANQKLKIEQLVKDRKPPLLTKY
jgi:hypothetical protein